MPFKTLHIFTVISSVIFHSLRIVNRYCSWCVSILNLMHVTGLPLTVIEGNVVVVNITDNDLHPYVVASYHPNLGNKWDHGDYCNTLEEALEVFHTKKN